MAGIWDLLISAVFQTFCLGCVVDIPGSDALEVQWVFTLHVFFAVAHFFHHFES